MTTTVGLSAAVDAKTALFDRLRAEADGGLLQGWAVDYAFNGNPAPQAGAIQKQMYGGGWRTVSDDAAGEHGLLMREVITVSLYLRVVARPPTDVATLDAMVKDAAAVIARVFHGQPRLTGDMTWLGLSTGQGDYAQSDDETTVIHAYALTVGSYLVWGQ